MPKPKVKRPELKKQGKPDEFLAKLPQGKGYTKNKIEVALAGLDQTQNETVEQALARRKLKFKESSYL